jgi:aryl-alcohol dehydrogenase
LLHAGLCSQWRPPGQDAEGDDGRDDTTLDFDLAVVRLRADARCALDRLVPRYPFAEIKQAVDDSGASSTIEPMLMMRDRP